jgi:hypothetical protein
MSDDHHKLRASINDDEYEEIITYNELMDFIKKNEENDEIVWSFKHTIVRHQGHSSTLILTIKGPSTIC